MKSVAEIIKELETSFDPNTVQVHHNGRSYEVYPWIKPMLFSAIQQGTKPDSGSRSKLFQLKTIFRGLWRYLQKKDTLILTNSLEKRMINGKAYDKLFHGISVHSDLQHCVSSELIVPSNNFARRNYANPASFSKAILYLREELYARFFISNIRIENTDRLKQLAREHNCTIDLSYPVRKNLAQYKVMRSYLQRKKVKRLFLSVGYTNFGAVLAAKELNIPVVELQHGVINEQHYGYNYQYFPNTDQFPDYLLTFGKRDQDFIARNKISSHITPRAVGSYILDHYANKSSLEQIDKIERIAVSLQDCETGVEAFTHFIALAKELPSVEFWMKRRRLPLSYYLEKYDLPENVKFEEDHDVYQTIVKCDIHLTAYSSCALEAPALGRGNILFNLNDKAHSYYDEKLKEENGTVYCQSVEDMKDTIQNTVPMPAAQLQMKNTENIAARYKENINRFVNELLTDE